MNIQHTAAGEVLEIIAFTLHDQQYCVKTTSIREIRGWGPITPLPRAPAEVLGVMNLRGTVIPIVDLAVKLGMAKLEASERSAIVVTSVKGKTVGLMVDGCRTFFPSPLPSVNLSRPPRGWIPPMRQASSLATRR